MITEFMKQRAVCDRWERKSIAWLLATFFMMGASVAAIFIPGRWFWGVLACSWTVMGITQWHVRQFGRAVKKLGEKVGK